MSTHFEWKTLFINENYVAQSMLDELSQHQKSKTALATLYKRFKGSFGPYDNYNLVFFLPKKSINANWFRTQEEMT